MAIISKVFDSCAAGWFDRIITRLYAALVKEDIPPGFQSHVFVMRVTGAWPTTDDSRWYQCWTIAYFLNVGIFSLLSIVVNIFYANSLEEAMNHTFVSLTCWTNTFKACILYKRRNSIYELFDIHERFLRTVNGRSATANYRIVCVNVRAHIALTTLYFVWWMFVVAQIVFAEPENRALPSTRNLPYAYAKHSTVYLSVLVYQIACDMGHCISASMADTFYIALMNTICGHVAELKVRLRALGNNGDGDLQFIKDMIDCCKRYEDCLRCESLLNINDTNRSTVK